MELALLIIVVACVLALIYFSKKRKGLEDKSVSAPTYISSTSSTMSVPTDTHKEKEKPSGPPQNTIYQFTHRNGNRVCPFCDGENSAEANICSICGRDI